MILYEKSDPLGFLEFKSLLKKEGEKSNLYNETIQGIIQILNNFFKGMNISTYFEAYPNKIIDNIWKIINYISYNSKPIFIKYGKGSSLEAAIASGYGELIERIQAGFFFTKNPFKLKLVPKCSQKITSDHKKLNLEFEKIIHKNNPYLPHWNNYKMKYFPHFDLTHRNITFIQNRFFPDSNGFAAGNSIEEAFIQGLCEVFERFSIGITLLRQKKCPDIQPKYLNYKNRKYLNIFEKNGIEVKIKDLSLGVGIPSVGLLLKHDRRILEGTQRFHYQNSFPFNSNKILEFKAGSGTNINVALDRCFTETIQCGYNRIHRLLSSEYHLSRAYSLYNIFPQISNYLSLHAFLTLRYAHHGFYPTSKLSFLEEDKNEYEDWDYSDKNLLNEIRNLISLCIKNNWRIYVRDYSWLGFPTLKVFSPELYFGFGEYLQYETKDVFKFKNQILRNFRSINNSNLPILLDPAFLIHIALNNSFNKFFNFGLQIHDSLSMWEFFSLLAYSQNEDKIAKKYFLQYLTEWNSNIFRIKSFKSDRNKISSFLESLIPNCGKNICRNCQYYDKCKYPILKSLEKSIIHKRPDIFERVVPQQEYQELDKFF